MDWTPKVWMPKTRSKLRPVVHNMQSVSSAQSATNSPRFFVGGADLIVFGPSFFLGSSVREKVNSLWNMVKSYCFHSCIAYNFSPLWMLGSTPTIYRSLTPTGSVTGMTGMTGTPVSSLVTEMPGKGAEILSLELRNQAEIHELKILGCWKIIKNKLTSQQKLENCLQVWDNFYIIANSLICFLLCFMFSWGIEDFYLSQLSLAAALKWLVV